MLEIRGVSVRYGDTVAVDAVDLDVAAGEVVCLLGPSGCGKTSLLRAVAGLQPHEGRIRIGGRDVTGARPDQRDVGLMFQDHALFPHRDVHGNVAFGLRMRGWSRPELEARVAEVLDLVGLAGYRERPIDELSGGEQQRVALARALAPEPPLLLLDEPLGSLDRALRDRLLAELPVLFDRVGVTVLYVTHDQDEALAIADRVAVMRAGAIVQLGTPDEVWGRPADPFVARFVGLANLLDGDVVDGVARTAVGDLPVPAGTPAGAATVVLPPASLHLDPAGTLAGTVTARSFAGDHFVLRVAVTGGVTLEVPVWGRDTPRPGAETTLAVDGEAVVVLPR